MDSLDMSSHWNTVQPTIIHFDGRCYRVPDFVASNWMHSGSACSHIKYCFCVHPTLVQTSDDHSQYDDYWHELVEIHINEQRGGPNEAR